MTREDELCLQLTRRQLTPELRCGILEFLATPLQWPLILERAQSDQVYHCCIAACVISVFPEFPGRFKPELKRAYLANAMRNLRSED